MFTFKKQFVVKKDGMSSWEDCIRKLLGDVETENQEVLKEVNIHLIEFHLYITNYYSKGLSIFLNPNIQTNIFLPLKIINH